MENILFFNPDIRQLAENITIGPQSAVQDLIDDFNDIYINNGYLGAQCKPLGITKKFYWKPGAYDTIKNVIYHQGEMHKKAASLWKVIDRIRVNGSWRLRELSTKINDIEGILLDFRQKGIIMQDNTDEAVEAWEIIKHHFTKQFQDSNNAFTIYVEDEFHDDVLSDYYLNIVYEYDDVIINYRHHGNPDTLAEILVPGEGHLTVKIPVSRLINLLILAKLDITKIKDTDVRSRRYNNRRWFYNIGGNYESYQGIEHPYISRNSRSHGGDHVGDFKHVCVGNMDTEIAACIKSLDFISLKVFFDRIMTHFDTNTGPLNRIYESYYGQPKFLEGKDEYYKIIPKTETNSCRYRSYLGDEDPEWIRNESYCATYCTVKKNCDTYRIFSKNLTKEEVELKAIEQATINAARRVQ